VKPFEQERAARQAIESAIPCVEAQIEEASNWMMFSESRAEILAELQKDPHVSLEIAYQRVVLPKLAANRDAIRADVLKELQSRPHSTTTNQHGVRPKRGRRWPQDTADIARQAMRGLKV